MLLRLTLSLDNRNQCQKTKKQQKQIQNNTCEDKDGLVAAPLRFTLCTLRDYSEEIHMEKTQKTHTKKQENPKIQNMKRS
jgi:hypothetical protein